MQVSRTYPQPDLGHLDPRCRALNLFKYLLGFEPEEAKDHPMFGLVVASYEAAEERGNMEGSFGSPVPLRTDSDSKVDLLVTGATVNIRKKQ